MDNGQLIMENEGRVEMKFKVQVSKFKKLR